jgi:hypothetical protein
MGPSNQVGKRNNYDGLGLTRKHGSVQAKVIATKLLAYKGFSIEFQAHKWPEFVPLIRAREGVPLRWKLAPVSAELCVSLPSGIYGPFTLSRTTT